MYLYVGVRTYLGLDKGNPFLHAGYEFDVVPARDEALAHLFTEDGLPCANVFENLTVRSWLSGPVELPNRCGLGESSSLVVDGYQLVTSFGPLAREEMYSIISGWGAAVFYVSTSEWEAWEAQYQSLFLSLLLTWLGAGVFFLLCVCWCLLCQ